MTANDDKLKAWKHDPMFEALHKWRNKVQYTTIRERNAFLAGYEACMRDSFWQKHQELEKAKDAANLGMPRKDFPSWV